MIFPFIRINDGAILDHSSWVVENGAYWEPEIYRAVEEFIEETQSDIRIKRGSWATGFLDWAFGNRQDCLRVKNGFDPDVRTLAVCISAVSYGQSLAVNWWLLSKPGFLRWLLERAGYWLENKPVPTPLAVSLDVRQQETILRPFTSITFTATQTAVQQVMEALGHDLSDVHSTSGFLK